MQNKAMKPAVAKFRTFSEADAATLAYYKCQRPGAGIRVALGAQQRDVLRLAMSQGIKLTITSLALGVIGALGLTRSVASVLFGVQPTDPVTFLSIAAILSVVALVASYIPAFRATKVDPMVALGYE